ncbi:MAG TPA: hypothetical protein VHT03_09965 [Rhizomicrobium sp.]|jgi:hypothetical protein|nr:hypothetical protein [Rhizomicrobium sp.]
MKRTLILFGAAALAAAVSTASADPYKEYTPDKGVWQVTTMKIDPNHIDDYLVGLKKSWVPGEEMSKKHGVIDNYFVMVNPNAADPAGNVILGEHYVNFATMDPNKDRDVKMQNESLAQMSKDEGRKLTNGFDKYRAFMGEAMWTSVSFTK